MDNTPAQTPPTFRAQTNGQHVDAVWQAALQHMMTSPGQLQKFVQAFASQQPVTGLGNQDSVIPQSASVIQAYDPNQQDYLRWFSAPGTPVASAPASLSPPLLAPIHPEDSASLQILLDEQQRLQKNYEDAAEIDADMDMLQSSINSLIHNLGIDPASLAPSPPDEPMSPTSPTAPSHPGAVLNGHGSGTNGFAAPMAHDSFTNGLNGMHSVSDGMGATQPENLLDSLLSQIGDGHSVGNGHGVGFDAIGGHMMDGYQDITNHYDHNTRIDGTSIEDASTEQLTAFLDEAAGAEAAPGVAASRSPKVGPIGGAAAHQKRKSDVIDLQLPISSEGGTGKKAKRKR
ncbi:hypothetical protein BD311DRAFT_7797 [Dichomitus squalens]|uniref:Uncharacterized protein n=1 Tax=Dichomitus squalens TaxID=114155 RepID=A0A4Q9N698_9APHY|nr:hypothetical protein BD311DRAFT_7797 [Dichomitus squalens]